MKLGRCPVCHSSLHLDAMVQDEAGRELLALLAGLDDRIGRALVLYLGLFRSASRDLDNARALKLAREALALCPDCVRLSEAMMETVEAIRAKGETKPMASHNYLKRVLESMPASGTHDVVERRASAPARPAKTSATVDGIMRLEALKRSARTGDAS